MSKYSYFELIEQKDYEAALKSVFEHIEDAPNEVNHYINGAILLQKFNQVEEAEVFLQKAISLDEHSFLARFTLGNLYYDNQRYEEAIKLYLHTYTENPSDSDLNYMIAMSYVNLGDYKMALPFFETSYQWNQTDTETLMQYGLACCQLELYKQGKRLFEQLNGIEENADAYYNLGLIEMMEDNLTMAEQHFDAAVDIQPDHYLALNGLNNLNRKE